MRQGALVSTARQKDTFRHWPAWLVVDIVFYHITTEKKLNFSLHSVGIQPMLVKADPFLDPSKESLKFLFVKSN